MANENCFRGFTLIEVLVASALLATASIVGVAAYRNYAESQKIQNATLDVALMLQKAKSRAQTQVKPANVANCQSNGLNGYEVRICNVPLSTCSGAGRYELHIICGGLNTLIERKQTPSPVSFLNTSSPVFTFKVLQGTVNSGSVTLSAGGVQKIIQVSGLGDITIQ